MLLCVSTLFSGYRQVILSDDGFDHKKLFFPNTSHGDVQEVNCVCVCLIMRACVRVCTVLLVRCAAQAHALKTTLHNIKKIIITAKRVKNGRERSNQSR